MNETYEAARELIGKGLPVTLLEHNGRKYLVKNPWAMSIVEIRFWLLRLVCNLGIFLKGSGLCVLDCDSERAVRHAGEMGWIRPSTLANRTRKGLQFLFQHSIEKPTNRIRFCAETDLIFNNAIAISPSTVGGVRREWTGPVPKAKDLPVLPPGVYVEPRPEPKTYLPPCPEGEDFSRALRYVRSPNLPPAVSGANGHGRFFWTCCRLLKLFPGLTWDQFVETATVYSDRCEPPFDVAAVVHKCRDSWAKYR
jgi:hypothetical protein